MLNPNFLFLAVAIISLVIFIFKYLITIKVSEGFEEATPDASGKCPSANWWDTQPVKTIISKQSGVHFPVVPIDPSLAIKSPVLLPIHQKGSNNASSCLYVNDDGTYSTAMCDKEIGRHQWLIKVIQNEDDFKAVMANKPKQPGDLGEVDLTDKTFNFCLVVSKHVPHKVLHYENNSLAVRDVGYFHGQHWLISPKESQAAISVGPVQHSSLFTPELSQGLGNGVSNSLNPIAHSSVDPSRAYYNNINALNGPPSETSFGGPTGNNSGGLNFKIVVDSNNELVKEILSKKEEETEEDSTENFQDTKKKCKCNGCKPFDLRGWIKNKKIPCMGCNFDQ